MKLNRRRSSFTEIKRWKFTSIIRCDTPCLRLGKSLSDETIDDESKQMAKQNCGVVRVGRRGWPVGAYDIRSAERADINAAAAPTTVRCVSCIENATQHTFPLQDFCDGRRRRWRRHGTLSFSGAGGARRRPHADGTGAVAEVAAGSVRLCTGRDFGVLLLGRPPNTDRSKCSTDLPSRWHMGRARAKMRWVANLFLIWGLPHPSFTFYMHLKSFNELNFPTYDAVQTCFVNNSSFASLVFDFNQRKLDKLNILVWPYLVLSGQFYLGRT